MAYQASSDRDDGTETRKVSKEEAAFILGQGGKTKAKLCAVSGAQMDLTEGKEGRAGGSMLQVRGTAKQRKAAMKYINFVIAQRLGPVKIDDVSAHDDLTILVVPASIVNFITGTKGSFLRLVEEEWRTLLFFLQVNPKNPTIHADPNHTERLAIFGPERRRRGAELKVMSAIEIKKQGHFTKNLKDYESPVEGFATDTMILKDEDYSYALGSRGSTRRKLARASSCIVEYVGRVAYFCGTKTERKAAREYLQWLLMQRVGQHVHVDHKGRSDVTMIMVPSNCIGYVTGFGGYSLRAIEEETSTFCFIEGMADDKEDQKPLMIFGCAEDRKMAETLVWERIWQKMDDPVTSDNWTGYHDGKGKRGKGKGKDRDWGKGKDHDRDHWGGKDHGKGKGKGHHGGREGDRSVVWPPPMTPDQSLVSMEITDDDAAFLMGPSGKTKKKIAAVSGAQLELKTNRLEIVGTKEELERAKKYIHLVMAQRVGPVHLEDVDKHEDLSIIEVPAEAVSFVTGKAGSFLRLVEEDFGTLLFFIDFNSNKSNRRDQLERLAIFGPLRERRGAELKVMAAIEVKMADIKPNYFTGRDAELPMEDPSEGFATDRMVIKEDDYSYALGKGGTTRKKIARASCCVIEYIGRLAYLSGTKKERVRAREYLGWLFRQRVGSVEVDYSNREDVTVMQVPKDCVGFVTGRQGKSLRAVEDATGTFCFIEGGRDDPDVDPKPLLIFGDEEARRQAETILQERIDLKLVEGWVHEGNSGYPGYDGYNDGGKGYAKGGGKHYHDGGRRPPRGKGKKGDWGKGDFAGAGTEEKGGGGGGAYEVLVHNPLDPTLAAGGIAAEHGHVAVASSTAAAEAGDQEDDGAWGDWGGSSSDEIEEITSLGAPPATVLAPKAAPSVDKRAGLGLIGASGRWSSGAGASVVAASPQRAGKPVATATVAPSSFPMRAGEEESLALDFYSDDKYPALEPQMLQSKKGKR